jgi:predicted dehydrogenase
VLGDAGSAVIDDDELVYFHSRELAESEAAGDAGVTGDRRGRENQVAAVLGSWDGQVESGPADRAMFSGHMRQYRDVVDAIRTGRRPAVTVDDALLALATVEAVYASARTGAPVRVADVLEQAGASLVP